MKVPNWKPISVIALLVFSVIAFIIGQYAPTPAKEIAWEWVGGISFGIVVLIFVIGFARQKN